jgi:hypothetical protein
MCTKCINYLLNLTSRWATSTVWHNLSTCSSAPGLLPESEVGTKVGGAWKDVSCINLTRQ